MAGRVPEERVAMPVMLQGWRRVGFIHWRVEADIVNGVLPDGVRAEVIDGSAWVSLVPFEVVGARPPVLPALPVVSQFPETNLRTYVVGPDGQEGLWFLAIEAATVLTTVGARASFGAPYVVADMSVEATADGGVRYGSRRKGAHTAITMVPGDAIADDERTELDDVLTGRWRAYTRHLGRILRTHVQHQPWPLQRALVTELDESLTRAVGLPELGAPDLVHWSPGVDVRLSRPHGTSGRRGAVAGVIR